MYFEWKDAYEMGLEEVDKQHQKLFQIGRKLSVLIQTTDVLTDYENINNILTNLKITPWSISPGRTVYEGSWLPDLASHAMEHGFPAQKLLRLDKMEQHNHKTIVRLVSFVSRLIEHILITDMKIRNYLLEVKPEVRD